MYLGLTFAEPGWLETTLPEIATFADQHRDELDRCRREARFPRDLYLEMGKRGGSDRSPPPTRAAWARGSPSTA